MPEQLRSSPSSLSGVVATTASVVARNCSEPSEGMKQFKESFFEPFNYIALVICTFGVVTNVLNVIVLNHKTMRSSTNFILTALALGNFLLMFFYIIFDVNFLINKSLETGTTNPWAWYLLIYINFQNILHSFSSWMTVTLAVFRWIYIQFPTRSRVLCSESRAHLAVGLVFFISVLFSVPYLLGHKVVTVPNKALTVSTSNTTVAHLYTVDIVQNNPLRTLVFWVTALWIKLIPVVLLSLLSGLLIHQLRLAEKRRRTLKSRASSEEDSKDKRTNRTTKMLVAIVLLFIIAFLPQALLLIFDAAIPCFSSTISQPLGEMLDLLTLLNCSVTFVLYCIMSQQFRTTFDELFCKNIRLAFQTYRGRWRSNVNRDSTASNGRFLVTEAQEDEKEEAEAKVESITEMTRLNVDTR